MRIMEVDKIRLKALSFIPEKSNGLDLGFGGNAIIPTAICVDMEQIYCKPGPNPQHLIGDASNLYWFKDETMDYIFSSHLLEDFENTIDVLKEWGRVLKVGGKLLLYLPNEMRYRKICQEQKWYCNNNHKNLDMSLLYMRNLIKQNFSNLSILFYFEETDPKMYSFFIVLEKI